MKAERAEKAGKAATLSAPSALPAFLALQRTNFGLKQALPPVTPPSPLRSTYCQNSLPLPPLEYTLSRLAKSISPKREKEQREALLRRIHPQRLTALRESTLPSMRLRSEVMARIAHSRTREHFVRVRHSLELPTLFMERLRSEVLGRLDLFQPRPLWQGVIKWAAVTTVLALLLRIAPTFLIASSIEAVSANTLIPLQGSVSITDGAEWSLLSSRIDLRGPLTVRTGTDSTATIILGDSAVLRLGENTEVNLRASAFEPPQARKEAIARVTYGQVWVTSLLPGTLDVATRLVLPQGALVLKQGSVSLLADPQQSTIQVFHRFTEVEANSAPPIRLIEGEQLTLLASGESERHLVTANMRAEEWVKENLARDAAHHTEVEEHRQELAQAVAGILPTSAFYSFKRAAEELDLWLTFSSETRHEKKLQHAQTRINEAVTLLQQGEEEAAEHSLAEYKEAIRELASVTEEQALELLNSSLILSSTTVASALPHSPLYDVKKTLVEVSTELPSADLLLAEVDLYLLSDALLEIEELIANGSLELASEAFHGIEGAVASVLERQELEETVVAKDSLKALKTILRSIAFSLEQAEETTPAELAATFEDLQKRIAGQLPPETPPIASVPVKEEVCMSPEVVTRRTNSFLASVYTYQTPRGQRNEVLRQIALLPDCLQSGRILSKVMNKVPVFTRSFVWEALRKIGAGT